MTSTAQRYTDRDDWMAECDKVAHTLYGVPCALDIVADQDTAVDALLTGWANDESPDKAIQRMRLTRARELWAELGDIPVNGDNDTLEAPFLHFAIGTPRETVWHWFEDTFECSVAKDLMFTGNSHKRLA